MPNLLSLNNCYYRCGGSDAVMFEYDDLFSSLGWNTAIFSMHHRSNESSEWDKYFITELKYGESYSFMQELFMAAKVVYSLEARKKLSALLEVFTPDIAHAHCIYHHLSPSVLSLLHGRCIPTLITDHELKLACPAYKMFNNNGVCEQCKGGNLLHVIKNRCIYNSLLKSTVVVVASVVHRLFDLYRNNLDRVVALSLFFRDKLAEWGCWIGAISPSVRYALSHKFDYFLIPNDDLKLAPDFFTGLLEVARGRAVALLSAVTLNAELGLTVEFVRHGRYQDVVTLQAFRNRNISRYLVEKLKAER